MFSEKIYDNELKNWQDYKEIAEKYNLDVSDVFYKMVCQEKTIDEVLSEEISFAGKCIVRKCSITVNQTKEFFLAQLENLLRILKKLLWQIQKAVHFIKETLGKINKFLRLQKKFLTMIKKISAQVDNPINPEEDLTYLVKGPLLKISKPKKNIKYPKVEFTCEHCGKKFMGIKYGNNDIHFCCTECKKAYYWWKKHPKKDKKSLAQWNTEARACGMTYGQYRTQIERFGKTFEELKLDDPPDVSRLKSFFA